MANACAMVSITVNILWIVYKYMLHACFSFLTHWGRHSPDDIFKCFFLNENDSIVINISLKFVTKGPINNISALVQIMAWPRPGYKLLSEPMVVSFPTHICVTRPQWVKFNCHLQRGRVPMRVIEKGCIIDHVSLHISDFCLKTIAFQCNMPFRLIPHNTSE